MFKKVLFYGSFALACFVVVGAFITATTYTQLGFAICLYPLFVWFAYRAFLGHRSAIQPAIAVQPGTHMRQRVHTINKQYGDVSDIEKREFLKLVGATGVSIFLFSIFNKKIKNLFLNAIPGSRTTPLQEANDTLRDNDQTSPTDEYRISEIDDNIITYYGFIKENGAWFIMRQDTDTGTFRYIKGDTNFSTNWQKREKLKYDYFNNVF